MTSFCYIAVLRKPGIKTKLNNLLIQLRKNCAHPDLFNITFDANSMSCLAFPICTPLFNWLFTFICILIYLFCFQVSIHLLISFWSNAANFSCWTDYWMFYSNGITRLMFSSCSIVFRCSSVGMCVVLFFMIYVCQTWNIVQLICL
jgi:hypothetical protein